MKKKKINKKTRKRTPRPLATNIFNDNDSGSDSYNDTLTNKTAFENTFIIPEPIEIPKK